MNRTDMTLQHTFRNLWLAAQRAWNAERARNELRQLPDRTLKDIGLTRGQIDALFR